MTSLLKNEIPFKLVSQEPHTVTLRERDTTSQVRIPVDEVQKYICLTRVYH